MTAVEQAIVAGAPDTVHDAVVYVGLAGGASCSGTMILTNPSESVGYVLTAAHCLVDAGSPKFVLAGSDPANPSAIYIALDGKADTRFPDDVTRDLAVIRVVGVDARTPTIPILEPTAVPFNVGTVGTVVGYGATDANYAADFEPSLRRQLAMSIVEANPRALVLTGLGDACFGDSGGPFLVEREGTERVAAVASSVDGSCFLAANEALVNPTFGDQLAAFMREPVPVSCDRCVDTLYSGKGACVDLSARCNSDQTCEAMRFCSNRCAGDARCYAACTAAPVASRDLFLSLAHCGCDPCADECANEPRICPNLADLEAAVSTRASLSGPTVSTATAASGGCGIAKKIAQAASFRERAVEWLPFGGVLILLVRRRRRR